jgi:hypothetical protein
VAERKNGKKSRSTLPKKSAKSNGSHSRWVTLREASDQTGISVSTLRNWYGKGLVNSRVEKGPNGAQRLVMLEEISERVAAKNSNSHSNSSSSNSSAGTPSTAAAATQPAADAGDRSLSVLIEELALARERAGRAEARAELLAQQLTEARAQSGNSVAAETLKEEIEVLRARVDFHRDQNEELKRRLIVAELDDINENLNDGEPLVPPEEEDEFLAMTQRWRARRKRRRFARREAKAAKRRLRTS